jgi:hypothetical protein
MFALCTLYIMYLACNSACYLNAVTRQITATTLIRTATMSDAGCIRRGSPPTFAGRHISIRLSLSPLVLLVLCATSLAHSQSHSINVVWFSPSKDDTYYPGTRIYGNWSAGKPVVSPSFRLCNCQSHQASSKRSEDDGDQEDNGDDDGDDQDSDSSTCGTTIWPEVQQVDSIYSVSLYVFHSA